MFTTIKSGNAQWDEQVTASVKSYEDRGWVALELRWFETTFAVRYRLPDQSYWTVYQRLRPVSPAPPGLSHPVTWLNARCTAVIRPRRRLPAVLSRFHAGATVTGW